MGCIFFFKQKTAYEMRISDWSSDVCSSDLPAETCVLARALERHAATRGTDTYAAFEDGARWSFADTLAHVRTSAAGLQALGVRKGDRVLIMLPNGAMDLRPMFATNWLGRIRVPTNTDSHATGRASRRDRGGTY